MNRHLFMQGHPSQLWELREYESQLEEEQRKEEINQRNWNRAAQEDLDRMLMAESGY